MSVFRPSQAYRADLDIRLGAGRLPSWIRPPAEGAAPNSPAWLAVMPRRAGKTWLAQGIAALRADGGTVRVDLRSSISVRRTRLGCLTGAKSAPLVEAGQLVIVDEPALARPGGPGVPPEVLAAGLQRVRDGGATTLVLATPAESALLVPHLGPDVRKDVLRPPVLDAGECARMAARAPQWAPALVERLGEADPGWLHTPFLLELALHTAEERPALRADPEALLRAAVEVADDRHEYIQQWFHNGLGEQHRAALRAGRWRAAGLPVELPAAEPGPADRSYGADDRYDDAAFYGAAADADAGQDRARGGASLAGDPVLARHLPEVLRVHHISDLHHGGRLSSTVDAKDPTQAGHRIAAVAGAGTALDSYLDHVGQLAAQGRAPHLVVVTGDIVDRPSDTHGALAREWLDRLAGLLAPHRDLRPDDPRVLLVGGNHDVSWDLALDPSPQARHRWFAANFTGLPHPDLQLADPRARRLYVGYRGVGLRFALLGSAESGGEAARDEDRELLRGIRQRYLDAAGGDGGTDADAGEGAGAGDADVAAVVRDFVRHDPGVIARGVLDRLAAERGYVTVAALHHPLSPVPAVEVAPYSGVVNAGQAKRALAAARTSLVLHGHTHLGFAAAERLLGSGPPWTVRIAGAPALASRETEERNGYNELFVAREGGAHTLAVRTVRLDGGQWTPGEVYAFRPGAADERELADLCADGRA
ncbi:metallophosphoesterase [Streptomyces cocklensis]|uniref:Calcineurin-like phosphoesterase n=1 Tax=Actinacidiphila cocklensis TaxID=887465 RepID=A0A9W4DVI9_9ACTN|nr:metallophosphoesterase [Actinacidiphila cocklensis]MDD1061780.1 metallophosphoesterase [Actinacidiphila cocklensis]CAG6396254.1 Calcineurin-like phosphoesterase [Actinacidiphila cocklensis]